MQVASNVRPAIAAAFSVLLFIGTGHTQQAASRGPLSLAEAIAVAAESNPDYLSQRNQLRSAEWGIRSAYGNLLPSLSASTNFGYTATGQRRLDSVVLGEQPAMYSSRYSLGMSLSLNGTTLLGPALARAQARATEEQVEGAAASLESDVTQRYLSILESRDAVTQAERELARTETHVQLAQARFQVGAGTALDLRRSEVQRGQAQVRLVQAQNTAANDVLLLSQSMGVRLPLDVELSGTFALFEPMWTADQLIELALADNPTLQASRAQADAAHTRARAAKTTYLPSISFSAGLSGYVSAAGNTDPLVEQELARAVSSYNSCIRQNDILVRIGLPPSTCSDPAVPSVESAIRESVARQNRGFPFDYIRQPASASVTISLPIFTGLNREQQIEEANIARLNAQNQVRSNELRVQVDIETALRNLQTAYQSALLQRALRETSQEELRLAEERFRFGANTSVEVTDAQASLAEAERAEIAAVYAFHRSLAILESRLGRRLER
jgi:outer membrane protein